MCTLFLVYILNEVEFVYKSIHNHFVYVKEGTEGPPQNKYHEVATITECEGMIVRPEFMYVWMIENLVTN